MSSTRMTAGAAAAAAALDQPDLLVGWVPPDQRVRGYMPNLGSIFFASIAKRVLIVFDKLYNVAVLVCKIEFNV